VTSVRRADVTDGVLAVVLAVLGVLVTWQLSRFTDPQRPLDVGGAVLVVLAALVLGFRRRHTMATFVVSTVATSTYLIVGYPYGPILFSFFIGVYTLARHLPFRRSLPAAAVALPVLLTHVFTNDAALGGFLGLTPGSAWVVVPYALGITRGQIAEAAARERAELVRERVSDERLRVAQEVHDVVGHGLAAIKMQADVAIHVLENKPEQAATALAAISRTSKDALDELRSTLAQVRDGGEDRSPTPGVHRLDALRSRMADAGVDVQLAVEGVPHELSPAADLVAYRVVQESLTNVLRHSPNRTARVRVRWHDDAVELEIVSRGVAEPGPPGGLGIPGMRARVEALGGSLSARPTTETFAVVARIPFEEPP